MWTSTSPADGGRSFNKVKVPHGDNHGLWIDPTNSRPHDCVQRWGGDGRVTNGGQEPGPRGETTSRLRSSTMWPSTTAIPYYLYGSQQEPTERCLSQPAQMAIQAQSTRPDWYDVGGGEAGYIAPYLPDPNIVYAGDYEALITRFDKRTGDVKNISVHPEISDGSGAEKLEHRFQWTAPIVLSPHDPNTIYHGGERLFKSTDSGYGLGGDQPRPYAE